MTLLLGCSTGWAADPAPTTGVQVTCHGKLRHGLVAIGGETTGTTITLADGLTWELKLPDEATRRFAANHHKDQVTVTGRLRRETGVAIAVRWIVDVEQLTPAKDPRDTASVIITGKLRPAQGAAPSVIEIGDNHWPIALENTPELEQTATRLAGHLVQGKGTIAANPHANLKNAPLFRLTQLQPAETIPGDRKGP